MLEEDTQLKLKMTQGLVNATLTPHKKSSLFENIKKFKEMFTLECSMEYWKSLMRDVVRHNVDKKVGCSERSGDACNNSPLCSTIYKILKTDKG